MEPSPEILEKFRKKAEAASAIVSEVDSMAQAVAYTVDLCAQKEACQLLLSGCEESLSEKGKDLCGLKEWGKIIVAPLLNEADQAELVKQASAREISVIKDGMRRHLAGVDIALLRLTASSWRFRKAMTPRSVRWAAGSPTGSRTASPSGA